MAKKAWQLLLQSALETEKYEITCMECFDLLDQYADLVLEGVEPSKIMPKVKQHLNHCPGCTGEFEALITMLQDAANNQQSLAQ